LSGVKGLQKLVLTVAAVSLAGLAVAQVAQAKVWHVNSTADPGSGCSAANCTLRAAIGSAGNGDTVDVPAGKYHLTTGPIHVLTSIGIVGAGAKSVTIGAGGKTQILLIPAGSNVRVTGVTLAGGFRDGDGGAIRLDGSLDLSESRIENSRANSSGGAIYSDGTLSVTDTTFSADSAQNGAGIYNDVGGTLTVQSSIFTGNTAGSGGGIYDNGANATTVTNSTLTGNSAGAQGGAIYTTNSGPGLTGINLTVVANGARDGSNIFFNSVTTGGFQNTIVAAPNGPGRNCDDSSGAPPVSLGHNLEDDSGSVAPPSCNFTAASDLTGVAPKLGPLANNGGPTKTMALLAGSPAINAGATVKAVKTDQRGGSRPQPAGGAYDIGAYERGAVADLKLSMTGAPKPATVGQHLVYTLKATYTGPTTDPALGVHVLSMVPSGVTLKSATPSQGSCSLGSGTATCAAGALAKGDSVTVKVTVIPNAVGKTQSAGMVTGSATDPKLANNGASVHLQVQNRPAVHVGQAHGVLFKHATLRGRVNANNAATTYFFEFGRTTGYGSKTPATGIGHGTSALAVSHGLHGLRPGTLYHYRLVAQNSSGQSISHDRTFRTPQLPSLHVKPGQVTAGEHIHVYGNAGTCPVGSTLTLLSKAFPFTHMYKGLGAIYTTVKSGGSFSAFVHIPSSRRGGPYPISGLCGKFP
jgi:predicted outer membrane repeat protein